MAFNCIRLPRCGVPLCGTSAQFGGKAASPLLDSLRSPLPEGTPAAARLELMPVDCAAMRHNHLPKWLMCAAARFLHSCFEIKK